MSLPSSELVGQVWSILNDFHTQIEKIRVLKIASTEKEWESSVKINNKSVSEALVDTKTLLEESAARLEQISYLHGNSKDVQVQIEFAKRTLMDYQDEEVKSIIERQPLDERSLATQKRLQALHTVYDNYYRVYGC